MPPLATLVYLYGMFHPLQHIWGTEAVDHMRIAASLVFRASKPSKWILATARGCPPPLSKCSKPAGTSSILFVLCASPRGSSMPTTTFMPSISSRRNDAVAYVSSCNPILLAFISAVHTQRPYHCSPMSRKQACDNNSQRAHPVARKWKMWTRKA